MKKIVDNEIIVDSQWIYRHLPGLFESVSNLLEEVKDDPMIEYTEGQHKSWLDGGQVAIFRFCGDEVWLRAGCDETIARSMPAICKWDKMPNIYDISMFTMVHKHDRTRREFHLCMKGERVELLVYGDRETRIDGFPLLEESVRALDEMIGQYKEEGFVEAKGFLDLSYRVSESLFIGAQALIDSGDLMSAEDVLYFMEKPHKYAQELKDEGYEVKER